MLDAGVELAGVNVMTMDYGTSRAKGQSMVDAGDRRPQRPLTVNSAGSTTATGDPIGTSDAVERASGATPMIGQNDVAG